MHLQAYSSRWESDSNWQQSAGVVAALEDYSRGLKRDYSDGALVSYLRLVHSAEASYGLRDEGGQGSSHAPRCPSL